jgi:hypothetical protein
VAAFGVGPLVDNGVSLSVVYGWTALVAAVMALLSFAVVRGASAGGQGLEGQPQASRMDRTRRT